VNCNLQLRESCRIRLGQASLARSLRGQRRQRDVEALLLGTVVARHAARDLALTRRHRHAKRVDPHLLHAIERRSCVPLLCLEERERRVG
jgi:hypothetical protein